jgi:dephospho-CoA kinase
MFTVALTGGIGAGKSEATKAFAALGVPIVDLDDISHQLTSAEQPLLQKIATVFGSTYITEMGALDRPKMRDLVFNNKQALAQLNAIMHPAIFEEAVKQLNAHRDAPYTILAIPLLEADSIYAPTIDRILVIDCDEKTQIERVKQRSKLNEDEIKQIMQAQTPRHIRNAMADDLIENNGDIEAFRQKIDKIHQKYIKICLKLA